MEKKRFGRIQFIPGKNGGRFPFCNSLFIEDEKRVVIDPGAGEDSLRAVRESAAVDCVVNTHFHFDHISGNFLFDRSGILINDIEADVYRDRRNIARRLGMIDFYGEDWASGWLERIANPHSAQSPYSPQNRHEWWLSTARLDGTYRWGDVMDFGMTKMKVIGAPGHSAGFCCLHFPGEGVVYTGDVDLTSFGPWCFGSDGDIDLFKASAMKLADLDADTFITGHETGILSREDFFRGLDRFLAIFDARERRILEALSQPLSCEALCDRGLVYGRKFHVDPWVLAWNASAVKQHLKRLLADGGVVRCNGQYRRA